MKYQTIIKARRQLANARMSLDMLRAVQGWNVEGYHFHWHNALMNLGAIIEVLRTATRANDMRARQWVGSKFRTEILADPLLKFMYHARGADHHGTMHSAAFTDGIHTIPYIGEGTVTLNTSNGDAVIQGIPVIEGPSMEVGDTMGELKFILIDAVNEKNNQTFEVPTSHFGTALPDKLATTAGELTYQYYVRLLDDAEKLLVS